MQPTTDYLHRKGSTGFMLTSGQLGHLKTLIVERESVLRAQIRAAIRQRVGRDISGLETNAGNESEQSAADMPDGLDAGMLTHDVDELLTIGATRERLKDGAYGLCTACHGPIDFKRLLALPTAERCLSCQELHEREHPETKL